VDDRAPTGRALMWRPWRRIICLRHLNGSKRSWGRCDQTPANFWVGVRDRAQARRQQRQRTASGSVGGARPKYLLSGLLVCGECGGRYVVQRHRSGVVHYGCAAHYDRGPVACGNGRLVRREVVEERVLDYLPAAHAHRRYSLLHPLHSPWVPGALDGAGQHRIQPFRGEPVRLFQRRFRRWVPQMLVGLVPLTWLLPYWRGVS